MELRAGLELDVLIAEVLMSWPRIGDNEPFRLHKEHGGVIVNGVPEKLPDSGGTIPEQWRPSTELKDAVLVAEKLREDGWLVIMKWMPKEFYFMLGGGMLSEYDHRPQPDPEFVLKGKMTVDLEWMRKDDWRFIPIPGIISANTPALAICRAAVEAVNALEQRKREREIEQP